MRVLTLGAGAGTLCAGAEYPGAEAALVAGAVLSGAAGEDPGAEYAGADDAAELAGCEAG